MKILCISDSHGAVGNLYDVLEKEKDTKYVIFLGDGLRDLDGLESVFLYKTFLKVQGNCDILSFEPTFNSVFLENKKIIFTHGHIHSVKTSLLNLKQTAKENNANICLFGHTHTSFCEFFDGCLFLNPGSLNQNKANKATYAVINITDGKILYEIKQI